MSLLTMMFGLPGVPFLYQGEELGLDDATLATEYLTDPLALRNENTPGRDVCRTPMPWEPGPNLGFSTAATTWLPVGHDTADTVAAQRDDPASHLRRVRELLALRRSLNGQDQPVVWVEGPNDVVAFERGDLLFALHVSETSLTWAVGTEVEILFRTAEPMPTGAPSDGLHLQPNEAIVARRLP